MSRYRFPQTVDDVDGLDIPPIIFQALYVDGVPEEFVSLYRVRPTLATLFPGGPNPAIIFGDNEIGQSVGVEVKSGRVVFIVNAEEDVRTFLNSRIDFFTRTVETLMSRLSECPDNEECDEDDWIEMSEVATEIITEIDPPAMEGYWGEYAEDMVLL